MKKRNKIISFVAMGVIATALIVGNCIAAYYGPMITTFMGGTGDRGNGSTEENAESDALCQKIAEEGIVLLKNQDDALPLEDKTLNVFGWNSSDAGFMLCGIGSGSSTINETKKVSLLSALEKDGFELNQELIDFYKDYNSTKLSFTTGSSSTMKLIQPSVDMYTEEMMDNARGFSDNALVVISRVAGENVGEIPTYQEKDGQPRDTTRNYLELSIEEEGLLELVKENFSNVIVVINSSNAMELGFLQDEGITAALNVGLPGQSGALAIGKILDGTINPSGRLSNTYAYDYEDEPAFANYLKNGDNIRYLEDIYIGYKWYETADVEGYFDSMDNDYGYGYEAVVQYPFGFGMSYSSFEWSLDSCSIKDAASITEDTEIELTFSCHNTGTVAGKDVMEIYYTAPYTKGGIEKSAVNLIDFIKTPEIEADETVEGLKVTINPYDMASYDSYDKNGDGKTTWTLDAGDYELKFMDNAHTLKEMGQNVLNFKIDETITYDTDPVTGTTINNLFTGDTAYAGVPLDGSTVFADNQSYLSRSDFEATFPKTTSLSGMNTSEVTKANNYVSSAYDQTEMPVTGKVGEEPLYMVTKEDGSKASASDLSGDSGTKLVYNEDLLTEIGHDYDSAKLNQMIDQITTDELATLVQDGGFKTVEIESIGKPKYDEFDGPAGFNTTTQTGDSTLAIWTAFPTETLIGQTWSKSIARQMGVSVAKEGSATGISGWYAPGVNLHRTPFNGRNYEYYSEDPVLSGYMAANVIEGAKANGLRCYLKHFTLSEPGVNAKNLNTWLTEQNFRENYLKPFEIAVKKGGANCIMTAFNSVGGVWAGACYAMNVQILRNEWGFRGALITDWSDGSGNMNCTTGIKGGNSIWLNPNTGNNKSKINLSDPTIVYCAKNSAKDVVFSVIDTYNYAKEAGNKIDVNVVAGAFPYWIFILVGVDLLAAAGIGVWLYFCFRKNKATK